MPTPCPACCPQPPEPPCPEPEAITVKVWEYCVPYTSPEAHPGVTVTVTDVDGVLPAVQGTTDADGLVTVETGGPGTFDVTIDTGECVEVIEDVVVRQCERLRLPDQAPCCGQVCFDGYDYDTGQSFPGNPACYPMQKPGWYFIGGPVVPDGYFGATNYYWIGTEPGEGVCVVCDCVPGAVQTVPVAYYPWSNYTLGRGRWVYVPPEYYCLPDRDPCDFTTRHWWAVRRRIGFQLGGAEPIVGGGGQVIMDLIHDYFTDGDPKTQVWQADANFAGYGYLVTSEVVNGVATEISRTRVDFDFLRCRVVTDTAWDGERARASIVNYWTPPGESEPVPANFGWYRDNGDGTVTRLVAVPYCRLGDDLWGGAYPASVNNGACMICPGMGDDLAYQYFWGQVRGWDWGGPHALMDCSGTFWVGLRNAWATPCQEGYGADPKVTYRLWEV